MPEKNWSLDKLISFILIRFPNYRVEHSKCLCFRRRFTLVISWISCVCVGHMTQHNVHLPWRYVRSLSVPSSCTCPMLSPWIPMLLCYQGALLLCLVNKLNRKTVLEKVGTRTDFISTWPNAEGHLLYDSKCDLWVDTIFVSLKYVCFIVFITFNIHIWSMDHFKSKNV